ncbi:MAG: glycosyltransferase [Armatimonadota bacterium]
MRDKCRVQALAYCGTQNNNSRWADTCVVFVFDMLELGGAERQALLLARHLRDQLGASVEFVGFSHPGVLAKVCEKECFRWSVISSSSECSTRRFPGSVIRLIIGLRRLKPDILMPYTIHPNVMCGAFWRYTGAKTCIWNQRDAHQRSSRRWLERMAVRNTPRFVANSNSSAKFLIDVIGAPSKLVTIIPNGIQMEQPRMGRKEWRQKLGLSDETIVFCMLANLTRNKDHATLLRAWQKVEQDNILHKVDIALVLAGRPGDTHDELIKLVQELNISRTVYFVGSVDDVAGLLSACDVGVHSSFSEGCPNSVLEMMFMGLPVVGTNIEGIRDVLGSDSYDLLAPPGDAKALSEVIKNIVLAPDRRKEIGALNAERARKYFSVQSMCSGMTEVMLEALKAA